MLVPRGVKAMASITIRRLDDDLKKRLRLRAARNGRSMEDEARTILHSAAGSETPAEISAPRPRRAGRPQVAPEPEPAGAPAPDARRVINSPIARSNSPIAG